MITFLGLAFKEVNNFLPFNKCFGFKAVCFVSKASIVSTMISVHKNDNIDEIYDRWGQCTLIQTRVSYGNAKYFFVKKAISSYF